MYGCTYTLRLIKNEKVTSEVQGEMECNYKLTSIIPYPV